MSKMDGLRAMREARHAEMVARSKTANPAGTAKAPLAPKPQPKTAKAPVESNVEDAENAEPPEEALCGHRNMSGRTCTREHGHAAKSHRYS